MLTLSSGGFIAFRLWRLTRHSLYTDEIFSLEAARHSWSGLIAYVLEDVVHPPFFYLLLKAWVAIGGESLFWLRLFPVLVAVIAIIPFLLLCRELKLGVLETNVALVLVAVNPYLVYYSQELRMYSLTVLLSLFSTWLFVKFLNSESDWSPALWAFSVVNLLLVYTHYYGWLIIGAECFFLMIWKRKKLVPFSLSTAIVGVGFLPWIYSVMQSATTGGGLGVNLGWNPPPAITSLTRHFSLLSGPLDFQGSTYFRLLLFGCPVLFCLVQELVRWIRKDHKRSETFWLLLSLTCLPIATVFFVSKFAPQSGWLHRSLIMAAVPYMLLVSASVNRLRPEWVKTGVMLLIVGWATLAGVDGARRGEYGSPEGDKRRIAWNDWAHQLMLAEQSRESNVKVYAFDLHSAHTLWYYLDAANDKRFQVVLVKGPNAPRQFPAFAEKKFPLATIGDITASKESHFWIACRLENRVPQQKLFENGYQLDHGPVIGIPGIQYGLFSAHYGEQ